MADDDLDLDDLSGTDRAQLSTSSRLLMHEKICSFRYKTINARLGRMEKIMVSIAFMLLSGMAWMLFEFVSSGAKIAHG